MGTLSTVARRARAVHRGEGTGERLGIGISAFARQLLYLQLGDSQVSGASETVTGAQPPPNGSSAALQTGGRECRQSRG